MGCCTLQPSIFHDSLTAVRSAGVAVDGRLIDVLGAKADRRIIEQAAAWPAELIVCGSGAVAECDDW